MVPIHAAADPAAPCRFRILCDYLGEVMYGGDFIHVEFDLKS